MSTTTDWVKLVFNETPQRAIVKQGYLFDEGDFFRVVGDNSESLVRKVKVISITKRRQTSIPIPNSTRKNNIKKNNLKRVKEK